MGCRCPRGRSAKGRRTGSLAAADTHAVATLEQARQIVAWYGLRWMIGQVFRSMKSDCLRIEASQIENVNSFTKLAIIGLIAAVRSMQLVMAHDGTTGHPLTDAVDPADMPALRAVNASLEGPTEKLRNPHDESHPAWYAWIIARLGGWSGRHARGYRPPGAKTMHHGLRRLDAILAGWGSQIVPRMHDAGRVKRGVDDYQNPYKNADVQNRGMEFAVVGFHRRTHGGDVLGHQLCQALAAAGGGQRPGFTLLVTQPKSAIAADGRR